MFKCKSGCKSECCGNIPLSKSVIKHNRKRLQRRYESIELDNGLIHPVTKDGRCIFLNKQSQCEIYKERPFICKIYGTIIELQCPYIDLKGNLRTDEEIIQIRNEIKKTVDERFLWYEQKYLKGQILLPPFI